jgi:putative ABC transport system substrate-binding protein
MPDVEDKVEEKRVELLLELVPGIKRVAYIGNEAEWSRPYVAPVRAAAKRRGLELIHVDSGYGNFAPAFARARKERFDAIVVERSSRAYGRRQEVGALAAQSGVPSSCSQGELVEHGCMMSYGPDIPDLGRRAGGYVAKILRGTKPGDLPIEAPTKYELTINARTAKSVGIAIPQAVLLRATRVIE